jgi:hypothetical protein
VHLHVKQVLTNLLQLLVYVSMMDVMTPC